MNDTKVEGRMKEVVLEYELDAAPEKVWRAISIAEFREKWLPGGALAAAEPVSSVSGEEIRYRMRDDEPPFVESVVTFQLRPDDKGGTRLRIIHALADARLEQHAQTAANNNRPCLMRAA